MPALPAAVARSVMRLFSLRAQWGVAHDKAFIATSSASVGYKPPCPAAGYLPGVFE